MIDTSRRVFPTRSPTRPMLTAQTAHARSVGHVVVDRHGQTDGQREHHAHPATKLVYVLELLHVLIVDQHFALDAGRADEVDRAIDTLEQRGLARIGRADDPENLPGRNLN